MRAEIDGVYRLYQDGQLDSAGFGRFFKPLEERTKQLKADLPRLQAEIDVCQVDAISAEEIEKRTIIEAITEKIVVGKDEIDILSST